MAEDFTSMVLPKDRTKYIFFGGKGGVGKTTLATATAVWIAEKGYRTTIVSTDPTVSLSAMFGQRIGGDSLVPIRHVKNLCGLNINPKDARGVFQKRLNSTMGQIAGALGNDVVSTPCMEEMATFDQFVEFLEKPESDVIVFDTAPTGKTLRELAMPFDWAGFLQKQIQDGKKLASILGKGYLDGLESDKRRYDNALAVLRDGSTTVFSLVLLPERLPIEETQSAMDGLGRLGIPVQALVINQCIPADAVEGNRFLGARSRLQAGYLREIDSRFASLKRLRLPLLDSDVSGLPALRRVGELVYGSPKKAAG